MSSPPPHSSELILAFPSPHILLLTLNHPGALNSVTSELADELCAVLDWFERERELWVLVLTGAGRMFCAGADLKGWDNRLVRAASSDQADISANKYGFASISRRLTAKPIVAAVNGGAYGGGMEILLNCDLVVADENAKFALPEVRRGVVALQGGIPRLAHIAGHQRASEMLLLGKTITAKDAYERFGFINTLTSSTAVLPTALGYARELVEKCSPDSVQTTKRALILAEDSNRSVLDASWSVESSRLFVRDENLKEGLRAFVEKRSPVWKNPSASAKL
ncbi:ClpP/crotonase-like domain-containing protein [Desarmillaria tabescens]|uniref:ClpP/crotonase-like domain-containing protein n=1 Tax=Armillaria tabescens TaxID=1929756 RepID=A0AA39JX03_ARMTA|nr:ClpP/crotonase-like domain-containing protein [Desarmillaria tabescens]KAK0450460.1 ClpP/crotonase-like domain-containing protein [Desarmillaria tabescens]